MGFFDVAKNVGKFIIDDAIKTAQHNQKEVDRTYDIGRRKSDEELVRLFKSSSGFKKIGYAKVLEERGYLERNSEGKFKRTNKTLNRLTI